MHLPFELTSRISRDGKWFISSLIGNAVATASLSRGITGERWRTYISSRCLERPRTERIGIADTIASGFPRIWTCLAT